jgi:DNA-binding NarL/FixJ family response regulator
MARYRPAVVVLDIAAFGATGTQLHAELIRADPGVRVVLTTVLPADSLICAALSPVVPVLRQPVSGDALAAALAAALSDPETPDLAQVLGAYVSSLRNLTSTRDLSALSSRLADCARTREELLPTLTSEVRRKRNKR